MIVAKFVKGNMNTLKLMAELVKLVDVINEAGMPPEVKKDLKLIVLRINKILLEGLKNEQ